MQDRMQNDPSFVKLESLKGSVKKTMTRLTSLENFSLPLINSGEQAMRRTYNDGI